MSSDPFLELDEADAEFAQALGRLMMAWSDTELRMYRVLLKYAMVSDEIGRAIFSGARAQAISSYLQNISHNRRIDPTRAANLTFLLAQIAAINTARDRLAHSSSESLPYQRDNPRLKLITNKARASRKENAYSGIFSPELIQDMIFDLWGIQNSLDQHLAEGDFHPWEEDPGIPLTWRYKPPQPAPTGR